MSDLIKQGEAVLHAIIDAIPVFKSVQIIAEMPNGDICVARKGKKIKLGVAEKFWSRVDRSGGEDSCWEFSGWKNKSGGHGLVNVGGGKFLGAHRLAWVLTNGEISDGLCVCHQCDNPPCCNPKHLFLGTNLENWDDMRRKGRARGGKLHGATNRNSRFTESQVQEIRKLYSEGKPQSEIGKLYGVGQTTISYLLRGWRHVK